jgi:predicted DNA-binding transcriptional regulator YafY
LVRFLTDFRTERSMYSPTMRLLTMLELLQARGQVSSGELAELLEVDRRSVRRYVMKLQDLGIPVQAVRGPGGGYRLRSGYKLPPLMFTDDEAVALTLGLRALPWLGVELPPESIAGALAKLERVLPESSRLRVQVLQRSVELGPLPDEVFDGDILATLSQAVAERQRVFLHYEAADGEMTARAVDPYGIVNRGSTWYAAGYCHLRQDLRTFRLDRILALELMEEQFDPPAEFDLMAYISRSISSYPTVWEEIEVWLDLSPAEAERRIPFGYGTVEPSAGGVVVRARHDDLDEMARWLASFGRRVEIHNPPELRDALERWAEALRDMSGPRPSDMS